MVSAHITEEYANAVLVLAPDLYHMKEDASAIKLMGEIPYNGKKIFVFAVNAQSIQEIPEAIQQDQQAAQKNLTSAKNGIDDTLGAKLYLDSNLLDILLDPKNVQDMPQEIIDTMSENYLEALNANQENSVLLINKLHRTLL